MNNKTTLAKPILILIRAAGLASLAGITYVAVKADRWLHAAYPVKPGPGAHRAVRWAPPALAVERKPRLLSRKYIAITRVVVIY